MSEVRTTDVHIRQCVSTWWSGGSLHTPCWLGHMRMLAPCGVRCRSGRGVHPRQDAGVSARRICSMSTLRCIILHQQHNRSPSHLQNRARAAVRLLLRLEAASLARTYRRHVCRTADSGSAPKVCLLWGRRHMHALWRCRRCRLLTVLLPLGPLLSVVLGAYSHARQGGLAGGGILVL